MKKILGVAALLALTACAVEGDEAATDATSADAEIVLEGDAPGFEAVAPGEYAVEHANGDVDSITIHPGMTYSRIAADGTPTGGTIFMQGGKICFVVEGEEGQNCFSDGPVQEDGSMQTTSESGEVSTVRPVEGSAPSASEGSE